MKKIAPRIEKETWEEQNKAGRYNPGLVLVYKHRRIPIGSGYHDTIRVWTRDDLVYVMSVSTRHGYAGLEEFELHEKFYDRDAGYSIGESVFLQNSQDFPEDEDFFEWGDRKQFNHLWELIENLR